MMSDQIEEKEKKNIKNLDCIDDMNEIPYNRFSHTICSLFLSLSLGRTISRVHQSLLLTLTPIFILGEHGPDNMGRKWVYGRKVFTAVN